MSKLNLTSKPRSNVSSLKSLLPALLPSAHNMQVLNEAPVLRWQVWEGSRRICPCEGDRALAGSQTPELFPCITSNLMKNTWASVPHKKLD